MRLGIDASNLRRGGGVTHLANILRYGEPQRFGIEKVVLWAGRNQMDLIEDRPWLEKSDQPALDRNLLSRLYWQTKTLNRIAANSCDLLFAPGGLCSVRSVPYITMCSNLLPYMWKELRRYGVSYMSLRFILLRYGQLRSFRNAEGLIFLSRFCLKTLSDGLLPANVVSKAAVIPHGVEKMFFHAPEDDGVFADRDALNPIRVQYISIVNVYKHQWNVVDAIGELRRQGYPVELTLIGPSHPPALRKLDEARSRVDPAGEFIHYLGKAEYDDLPAMYRDCDIFLFASSCESFGLILLEAMASGLPIACSNRTTLPEILGDCGTYFDPENVGEITDAVKSLIDSDSYRQSLASKAFRRAGEYSWVKAANETMRYIANTARNLNIISG